MKKSIPEITLTFAIPYSSPEELAEALPDGVTLSARGITMPDGRRYGLSARPQDGEFAQIVRGGSTRPPTNGEMQAMRDAPILLGLYGPGGSDDAAAAMLQIGNMLCEAGASGVLNHNSGLGHGASEWRKLAADADDGGLHWALVATNRCGNLSKMFTDGFDEEPSDHFHGSGVFTSGMHCLGHRDVVVPTLGDDEGDWFAANNFCGYLEHSGRIPVDGDVLTAMVAPSDPEDASEYPATALKGFNFLPEWTDGDNAAADSSEDDPPELRGDRSQHIKGSIVPLQRVRYATCGYVPADSPMFNPYGVYVLMPLDPDDPQSLAYRPTR